MKIYLAGPEVFHPKADIIFAQKCALAKEHGFIPITPFDADVNHVQGNFTPQVLGQMIYLENMKLIELSDAVVANITPFRGYHMDVGTAFEIGVAQALGKKISCYTQDKDTLIKRVPSGRHKGKDGQDFTVENFDMHENLMIEGALLSQGRSMIVCDTPYQDRIMSMDGFVEALLQL